MSKYDKKSSYMKEDEYAATEILETLINKEFNCKIIYAERNNHYYFHFMQKGEEICVLEAEAYANVLKNRFIFTFHTSEVTSKEYTFNVFDDKNKYSFSNFIKSFSGDLEHYIEENKKTL
jgi:hypothetical protein